MKVLIFLLIFFTGKMSYANTELKIMSFNTMCDVCKGSDYFQYSSRLKTIRNIIQKYRPDLISLQEVRTASHINELLTGLPEYEYFTNEGTLFSYADPTLIYLKEKFKRKDSGKIWLGPKDGNFSFGWKMALPRQAIWLELEYKNLDFLFVSTHFDNRIENLRASAKMMGKILKQFKKPIIFAADTNITPDMDAYKNLLSDHLLNAYSVESHKIDPSVPNKDLCYLRKGDKFPECRVDHILLSQNGPWKIKQFIVDTTKSESGEYPSDHRPILTKIELAL